MWQAALFLIFTVAVLIIAAVAFYVVVIVTTIGAFVWILDNGSTDDRALTRRRRR